jgi:hypothetical protein
MDLATLDVWNRLVEQRGHHADQARLRLTPQAQQDKVVPRQNRVHHLRDDAILVSHDPGEQSFPPLQLTNQISPEFVLHGPVGDSVFRHGALPERS